MPLGVGAGAQQGPGTQPVDQAGQLLRPAGPEQDPARGRELEGDGQRAQLAQRSRSAGKAAEYFSADRGSAIISATVSRQTA